MAGYLEWVAITAPVVAVAALAVGLAKMRKRRQRQAAVRAGYEAWLGRSGPPAHRAMTRQSRAVAVKAWQAASVCRCPARSPVEH